MGNQYTGRAPAEERFWPKVNKGAPGGCWEWEGARAEFGHGYFRAVASESMVKAHRWAWEDAHGPIPSGMHVCHHCDNPPCVNPAHLFLGTHRDNMRDRDQKGRNKNYCGERHGMSRLTAAQVLDIRERCASGENQYRLAEEFGVGQAQISRIHRRVVWSHLREESVCAQM